MKTVTEIARRFNVSADSIRHYTKLGLLSPERDTANGYRRYGIQQERRLRFLLSAKRLGFSLKDIREILDMADSGDSPCPLVRKMIDQRLDAIREKMRDAQKLMSRMESASNDWHKLPNQAPSGESICHLIETWDSASSVGDHAISAAD
jgi:DNA-binding transcriptional MerR regulator